jgi:L-lactate dehydrogenase complex protein LldG
MPDSIASTKLPPAHLSAEQTQVAFMARVRHALTDRGKPVPLPDNLEVARVVKPGGDPVALFAERVGQAAMNLHRVPDEAAMLDVLTDLLAQAGAHTALMPEQDLPAADRIRERLTELKIKLFDPNDPDAAFKADVGITGVALAVAETGSIVLTSGGDRRRLASLAVPCHIAIVRRDQIVPDLLDWADRTPPTPPASTVLVSGPSKTADIELALVIGVHGPKTEHIILIG